MAISKVTTVQSIQVHPAMDAEAEATSNAAHPGVYVTYIDTFDDPSDEQLPAVLNRSISLQKFVEDDGDATDYSGEDALVISVCDAIWS